MNERGDIRIIIGASSQHYPGWIQTQGKTLDITNRSDWEGQFQPDTISRILAEHVWEHLAPEEADVAAAICLEFLKPGGGFRLAVPDRLFPNDYYQRTVQVGGPGLNDHPAASHKVVYDYRTLPPLFVAAGFDVELLEWWDDAGSFHAQPWDEGDGFIYRSARFDHRNAGGTLGSTSLIIDATKPTETR